MADDAAAAAAEAAAAGAAAEGVVVSSADGAAVQQLLVNAADGGQPLVLSAEDAAQLLAQAGLQLAPGADGEQVVLGAAESAEIANLAAAHQAQQQVRMEPSSWHFASIRTMQYSCLFFSPRAKFSSSSSKSGPRAPPPPSMATALPLVTLMMAPFYTSTPMTLRQRRSSSRLGFSWPKTAPSRPLFPRGPRAWLPQCRKRLTPLGWI